MAIKLEFDLSPLIDLIEKSPEAAARGAKRGLHDALDDWVREARDIAPIAPVKGGTLRRSITAHEIEGDGLNLEGTVSANATERWRGGTFNYAYYIHEVTEHAVTGDPKFLDKPAQENERKWYGWIEDEIKDELKKAGW
jgi:hypothetical protein